jgi:hypothetical protein
MEDNEGWLGIDFSGVRPVINSQAGHNQKSELDDIVEDALRGLAMVKQGEEQTIAGWIAYGVALNKGRAMFPSDEQFGQWVRVSQLARDGITFDDRAAAMWAAEDPDRLYKILEENPKVTTVRGAHAKWKKDQKPSFGVVPTDSNLRLPDQKEAERIKNLKDRQASTDSEAEKEAVQRKLDKYKEKGVDVDAVVDQKQEDQNRDEYFREKATRDEIAIRIATKLVEQANIRVIKTLVLHAFPNTEELEQAELDYTTQYKGA